MKSRLKGMTAVSITISCQDLQWENILGKSHPLHKFLVTSFGMVICLLPETAVSLRSIKFLVLTYTPSKFENSE
jgi:hypothetical protein